MQPEFNFFQHWYPLSPIEDLDPEIPVPVTLLGIRLVIWKPKKSENYRVFLDSCPHRLAPLSEGRVDEKTGNLMCSYHGWQFDAEGICTHISESWKKAYNLPTSADRLVIEFRNWFDKYCQGKLPWNEVGINVANNSLINNNHALLLDRYQQHTRHCSSCRQALKNLQRLQILLLTYFVIIISGVAILPDGLRVKVGLPLVITALLGMGVYAWLKLWLIPKFYFVDYIHATK